MIAILLSQAILLDRGRDFRAVQVGHCLAAVHALASVLHIELVNAAADARAHRGKLRLGLLHAAKRDNIRLQCGGANFGNLHTRRGDLGRTQLNRRAWLRALLFFQSSLRLHGGNRFGRGRREHGCEQRLLPHNQNSNRQRRRQNSYACSQCDQLLLSCCHLLVLSVPDLVARGAPMARSN